MKKIRFPSEAVYLLSMILCAFAIAMMSAADFGMSMTVTPAYILSLRLSALTFGQGEYITQGLVFVLFCILMKKVKLIYFSSFVTCLLYGAILDLWRLLIPAFNPAVTPAGSGPLPLRILFFLISLILSTLSVALCYRAYIYPQVYDFFVKCVCEKFGWDRTLTKRIFDLSFLCLALILSLSIFRRVVGIGVGTVILAFCNGSLIGFFDRRLDRYFDFSPVFPGLVRYFEPNPQPREKG